jgi:hypothetical protein
MNPSANPTATPAGIIGMPGWFASEQVAGFDRNRWLVSSEYASGAMHADQRQPVAAQDGPHQRRLRDLIAVRHAASFWATNAFSDLPARSKAQRIVAAVRIPPRGVGCRVRPDQASWSV